MSDAIRDLTARGEELEKELAKWKARAAAAATELVTARAAALEDAARWFEVARDKIVAESIRAYAALAEGPAEPKRRKMGPLSANDHVVVMVLRCIACQKPFTAGQYVTLVPLGPGDDPEAQEKARAGRAYDAVAAPVHYACATGED